MNEESIKIIVKYILLLREKKCFQWWGEVGEEKAKAKLLLMNKHKVKE